MRRPRSPLIAALLGACLILGACNQGGSTASSETEPAPAAQNQTNNAPGVNIHPRTDSPAPPSPSTSPSTRSTPTPSAHSKPSATPAPAADPPAGYASVSAPTVGITFALPADWSTYNTFDDAVNQEIADHVGTDAASVQRATAILDLMALAPGRDDQGVMEIMDCTMLALPLDGTSIEGIVRDSASQGGRTVETYTSMESATNGTIYYGILVSSDTDAKIALVYLPNSSGSYATTHIYASSTERIQELLSVIATTLR